jgi:allantoicase
LGTTAIVSKVEIDTNHFKGNFPESASLEGCAVPSSTYDLGLASWCEILPRTPLEADHRHVFSSELSKVGPVSHVRLNIFPDGGISRLRIYGRVAGH